MKIKVSEFRQMVRKALEEALQQEDHSAHSKEGGYSHDVEESVDTDKRAKLGYAGETPSGEYDVIGLHEESEFNEALDVADDDDVSSYNNAYDDSFKGGDPKRGREGTRDDPRHAASHAAGNTALANKLNKKYHNKDEALGSSGVDRPKPAASSAALHTKDKSQMQGVGPRPTMQNAFKDLGKKENLYLSTEGVKRVISLNKKQFKETYGNKWKEKLTEAIQREYGNKKK